MNRILVWKFLAMLVALAALSGCPPTGVVCKPGTEPCGNGCIDPRADRRNCGGCGVVCGDGQVCEGGACQAGCSAGLLRCGFSCVDATADVAHCGGCDTACAQGQACLGGVCDYPAVAACYWSGQLVGFDPETGTRGPLSDVGSAPSTLARVGDTLLSADGMDNRLYAALPSPSGAYQQVSRAVATGSVPNQVLVDGEYVYVVNAGSGTLQVLRQGADAGVIELGEGVAPALSLGTVAELPFGANTFPQGAVKLGSALWVPLYGGIGAEAADAGQVLQLVDVTDPLTPVLGPQVSLKGLDLLPFGDAGTPVARPWAIARQGDDVYVALCNLNPDTHRPAGPGLLARASADGGLSAIDLGAADCLNPQWVTALEGGALAVSCGGRVSYDANFAVVSVEASGVVLVRDGARVASWSGASCGGGGDCKPLFPGRMAAQGTRLLVSDQNGGRVVVLDTAGDALTPVRNVADALAACPVSPAGVANVSDLIAR